MRGKTAMQAVHRALYDISNRASIFVVAEADFRRVEEREEYEFNFYKKSWNVVRQKLAGGRALKLFITNELEDSVSEVIWLQRSVIVRLKSATD